MALNTTSNWEIGHYSAGTTLSPSHGSALYSSSLTKSESDTPGAAPPLILLPAHADQFTLRGMARQGKARHGWARPGKAGLGKARLGKARRGMAWRGKVIFEVLG